MPLVTTDETSGSLSGLWYHRKQGKKQVPFNKVIKPPLPYFLRKLRMSDYTLGPMSPACGTVLTGELTVGHIVTSGFDQPVQFTTQGQRIYNRAYSKFKDEAYAQASNLTSIVEMGKTRSMIVQRLVQVHKGMKALKRGRFKEFCDTFGIRPLKKHENTRWTRPKQFGGLWLEYWMGWAPTVGDVYKSVDALQQEIPESTIRAGSSEMLQNVLTTQYGQATTYSTLEGKATVWIQAKVIATNPNLFLANSLGLVNPIVTAFQVTPFSWLAGWFVNLEQVLSQFTDWVGLQLKDLTISVQTQGVCSWQMNKAHLAFGASYPSYLCTKKGYYWFSRHIPNGGLPLIRPSLKIPNGLSLSRGATLASLLATMFAPSKRV